MSQPPVVDERLRKLIERMRDISSKFRRVATGDVVKPEDHNLLVDFAEATLELATYLTLSGLLPGWVPILDVGKLDVMIVGEPRRPIYGLPSGLWYLERKPIFGYLYEDDLRTIVRDLNSIIGRERIPDLHFGDILTSGYWNYLWEVFKEANKNELLPSRFLALGGDVAPTAKRLHGPVVETRPVSRTLASLSVSVRVE